MLAWNKGRLPKAKEIAETDEGDGSGPAQLAVTLGMIRSDGISCVLTEVKQCLKAK